MGLLKAALGAVGGVMADQWREFFYCESLDADVLVKLGQEIRHPGLRRRVRQLAEHGRAVAEQVPCGYALAVLLEAAE